MDDSNSRLMHSYGPTTVSRPPSCHVGAGMLIRDDDIYESVDEGGPGASSGSLGMRNCINGDASPIGGNGSGLALEPGMGMGDTESHHFRMVCSSQQSSSSIQQRQQLQQQAHLGAASARSLGSASPKPIRRRMRMITSCLECRRRKLKCNKSNPCTNCLRFSRDCFYLGPKLDEASQLRLTEIKEKVGSLERQLERDVAKSGGRGFYPQRILADDVEEDYDEERDLEITPMVALDLTYEDDADGMDDIMDLGVQVGKMRLTEKIGGLNRPRISEEVCSFFFAFYLGCALELHSSILDLIVAEYRANDSFCQQSRNPFPFVQPLSRDYCRLSQNLEQHVLTSNLRYRPGCPVACLNHSDPFLAVWFPDLTPDR